MQKQFVLTFSRWWLVAALAVLLVGGYRVAVHAQSGSNTGLPSKLIARGAGTTIIEGGTGAPSFIPVTTRVAFHAEVTDGKVTGGFECLAIAPSVKIGTQSGDFTDNIMYVTGQVQSADVQGDVVTLRGVSECTGLGAGSNVPFTAAIRKGGPGATISLTVNSTPVLTFKEILMDGSFDVRALPALDQ